MSDCEPIHDNYHGRPAEFFYCRHSILLIHIVLAYVPFLKIGDPGRRSWVRHVTHNIRGLKGTIFWYMEGGRYLEKKSASPYSIPTASIQPPLTCARPYYDSSRRDCKKRRPRAIIVDIYTRRRHTHIQRGDTHMAVCWGRR